MVYEIVITSIALNDLKAAINWYNKKDFAISTRLINNFELSINKLRTNPEIYTLFSKNIRAIEIAKFPYKVFYYIKQDKEVIIIGLVHVKRSEDFIRKKFKD